MRGQTEPHPSTLKQALRRNVARAAGAEKYDNTITIIRILLFVMIVMMPLIVMIMV